MRKNLTEIVFILDRSGSMSGLEADTIGGFNSMIEKQKKAEGEALISTVLFDNTSEVIHDRVSVQNIKPMTDEDYTVRGCTALLDAIGGAIHHIGNVHKYARAEDVPEHTMFVITTDGMENASRRYDSEKVKKMIERQKEKYGWEFLFLGANIDAIETARHFGISEDRAVNYHSDSEGTQLNYELSLIHIFFICYFDELMSADHKAYEKYNAIMDDETLASLLGMKMLSPEMTETTQRLKEILDCFEEETQYDRTTIFKALLARMQDVDEDKQSLEMMVAFAEALLEKILNNETDSDTEE